LGTANKQIVSPISTMSIFKYVRYEVFTAVTVKNAVFWDVTPRGSCKNLRLGGTYCLHY
jgi:hypothetical protein